MENLEKAKKAISNGDLFDGIKFLLRDYSTSELHHLNHRCKKLNKEFNNGFITKEQYDTGINKISFALIDFINTKEKEERSPPKYKYLSGSIVVISFIIVAGILFHYNSEKAKETPTDEQKLSYKVLVTPFNPFKNCTIEESGIEIAQIEYLNKVFQEEHLPVVIQYYDDGNCPYDSAEIEQIRNQTGADIVLWGRYIENCGDNEVQINFRSNPNSLYFRVLRNASSNVDTFYRVPGVQELLYGNYQSELVFNIFNSFATKYLLFSTQEEDFGKYLKGYFQILTSGLKYFSEDRVKLVQTFHSIHETFAMACTLRATLADYDDSIDLIQVFADERGKLGDYIIKNYEFWFNEYADFVHLTRGIEIILQKALTEDEAKKEGMLIESNKLIASVLNVYVYFAYQYYRDNGGWIGDYRGDRDYVEDFFRYVDRVRPHLYVVEGKLDRIH